MIIHILFSRDYQITQKEMDVVICEMETISLQIEKALVPMRKDSVIEVIM